MATRRLTERVDSPFAGCRVDRAAGVIFGVKLCGVVSENGRDYPPEMFRRDHGKYDGAVINFNHGNERRVEDVGGRVRSPRVDPDGTPRGDAHLLKSHPMYERVMDAAEHDPGLFGFSHVAMCRTTRGVNGREKVEAMDVVESVDLVAQPATTKGLFESKGGRAVAVTLREWVAKFVRHPRATSEQILKVKRLAEDAAYGGMDVGAEMPPADSGDADPDDAVMAAFKAAIGSVVDQAMSGSMDPKEALNKIKTLLKSHGELNTDGTPDTDNDPETGAGEEAAESRRKSADTLTREAIDVCRKVGFRGFDADDLDMIAACPPARREAVAKRLMGSGGTDDGAEKPTSGGRHQFAEHRDERDAAKRATESKTGAGVGMIEKAADLPWLT